MIGDQRTTADTEKSLLEMGTPERRKLFFKLLTHCLNGTPPELDWSGAAQLLSEAALEWPGEEDDNWAVLTGLAALAFRNAIECGEIDPKQVYQTVGHA